MADILKCLERATEEMMNETKFGHDGPVGRMEVRYVSGSVSLVLYPGGQMNWSVWNNTLKAIRGVFLSVYGSVEFFYTVRESGAQDGFRVGCFQGASTLRQGS